MHSFKKNARHNLGKLYNILRPSEDDNTHVLISSPTPREDQAGFTYWVIHSTMLPEAWLRVGHCSKQWGNSSEPNKVPVLLT